MTDTRPARALVGLLTVGTLGCGARLPESDMHDQLRGYFRAQGIEPQTIRCPGPLARRRGAAVTCEVTVDDQRLAVALEVDSAQDPPVVRPRQDTLVTAQIEPEIARALQAQGQLVAEVRCPEQLWVVRPGMERRCTVIQPDGRRLWWIGTFTGQGSRHRARVVPASAPGSGSAESAVEDAS